MTANEPVRGSLVVLSGPSGSGKGTILSRVLAERDDTVVSVSATTRAPREGEVDGKDYYFVTREEFLRMIDDGEMLEYNEFCGNLYGTPKKEAERASQAGIDIILEIESNGAFNVKKVYPEAILVMIMPPSLKALEERLAERGSETEEVIRQRLATAEHEVRLSPKYDYILVNETGKIAECADGLRSILVAEHSKSGRMNDDINNFLNIC